MAIPDISAEITAFRSAAYGEDVREALIQLATKLHEAITSEFETINSTWDGYKDGTDQDLSNFESAWNTYQRNMNEDFNDFKNDVNEILETVDPEINKILDLIYDNDTTSVETFEVADAGHYISHLSSYATYEPLGISAPIEVNAGDIVVVRTKANNGMSVIAYKNDDGLYTGLVIGMASPVSVSDYYAFMDHDGLIVISTYIDSPTNEYRIIKNKYIENTIDAIDFTNKVSDIFELRKNVNLFNPNTDIMDGYTISTSIPGEYAKYFKSSMYMCTRPIEIKPNTIYYLQRHLIPGTTMSDYSAAGILVNEDGIIQRGLSLANNNEINPFTRPCTEFKTKEDAKYIIFLVCRKTDDFLFQYENIGLYEKFNYSPSEITFETNYYTKYDMLLEEHSKIVNDLFVNSSKSTINLFDKTKVIPDAFIDGTTCLPTGKVDGDYRISNYIPVKPSTVYYIYRPGSNYVGITCIKEDGTSELPINTETNEQYTSIYNVPRTGTFKTTANTKFVCFNIAFNSGTPFDVDQIGLYEGTSYPGYSPYDGHYRLSYDNLPADINQREIITNKHITIANSDKIGFFSNSYLNGYTIRTHHAIDNLGMYSDYIMYNYAKSGDDVLESLVRINNNETFRGDISIQNQHLTYGILAMYTNDGALYKASTDTYYQNCKKLCDALRAMGIVPILATEHKISNFYYGMMRLAEQEHYEFIDWGREAAAYGVFAPFWYNAHPATRSAWLWSNGLKPAFDRLPRPRQGIKLFRKRPTASSTIANLIYNNVYERAERFVEIYNGYDCLTKATEKYFDRIDTGNTSYEIVKSEYQTLHGKTGSVNFGTHALIEGILPYTNKDLTMLKVNILATGVSNAYIKKDLALSNMFSANRYIAFGITSGANLLSPNDTFTVTGGVFNDNILGTYTVSQIINNALVITTTSSSGKTTSGTDNPTTNISGLVLKGSYDYPNVDYITRFEDPLAEWVSLTFGGTIDLSTYITNCIDYDKVSILLVGTNITLSDISFDCSGTNEKERYLTKTQAQYKKGTSILTDTLLNDGTAWSGINSIPKYTPVASTVNTSETEPYPNGVTTVRVLQSGDSITQNIITTNLNDAYHSQKIQLRVIARYFPTYVDSDADWSNSEIVEGSYDCSLLSAQLGNEAKFVQFHVGAFWHEYICDITYNGQTSLKLTCDSKSVQIARVEFEIIG